MTKERVTFDVGFVSNPIANSKAVLTVKSVDIDKRIIVLEESVNKMSKNDSKNNSKNENFGPASKKNEDLEDFDNGSNEEFEDEDTDDHEDDEDDNDDLEEDEEEEDEEEEDEEEDEEDEESEEPPSGYSESNFDITAYWDHKKGPIHVVPFECKLSDNKVDSSKVSCLLISQLVSKTFNLHDKEGNQIKGNPGDLIGIWVTPGMRSILMRAGTKCFISHTGEKDVHQKKGVNPMKTFSILCPKGFKPKRVTVTDDYRKDSKHVEHWAVPKVRTGTQDIEDDDSIPF